jgi:hypothetical protein
VGDSVNDPRDRTEHGAMRGCGSCEAPWIREEVAVGCEGRGVNEELDEPFVHSGRDTLWERETCVDTFGRAKSGCADEICGVECEGWSVDDEQDEPFACSGREATWGYETSEVAV